MPAGRGLDLDAGEHRHLLAHHVRGDRDSPIADQVGAAFAQAQTAPVCRAGRAACRCYCGRAW
jgi:hypothetical protein